jgi:hypothetical protein
MTDARQSHTASLLNNGLVLVAGGKGASHTDLASAELYNPSTQAFEATNSMQGARSLDTATVLPGGTEVVIIGGRHSFKELKTADRFSSPSDVFTLAKEVLDKRRKRHTATLLTSSHILVTGGDVLLNGQGGTTHRSTPECELYKPETQEFTVVGRMRQPRDDHAAALLTDGTVLVTGGNKEQGPQDLYDPASRTFAAVGDLQQTRSRHRMVVLSSAWGSLAGKVLVIGGSTQGTGIFGGLFQALASVEIYDPSTKKFANFGNMTEVRWGHTATLLSDGRILIAGAQRALL